MIEFKNRIKVQRDVIKLINSQEFNTEISGLSKKAIERWIRENNLEENSPLISIIFQISDKLFFLANKSQEQITEDYEAKSIEISSLLDKLKITLRQL